MNHYILIFQLNKDEIIIILHCFHYTHCFLLGDIVDTNVHSIIHSLNVKNDRTFVSSKRTVSPKRKAPILTASQNFELGGVTHDVVILYTYFSLPAVSHIPIISVTSFTCTRFAANTVPIVCGIISTGLIGMTPSLPFRRFSVQTLTQCYFIIFFP